MKLKLKKVSEQVIVITGASSGIGLATARMAAEAGAKLIIAARNEVALSEIVDELRAKGYPVAYVSADVAVEEDVRKIARAAIEQFGRIDTWINNAAVSVYGKLIDVAMEDSRRLFETNFFGLVHGSRIAVENMRAEGGALINIGSTLSDRAIPLQGMYSATKHAVKGFTDALRMELEDDRIPISVTLIKPGAIDTPYPEHAKNYLEVEPQNAPPLYSPRLVAEAILHAAEHPVRDLFVGGSAKMLSSAGKIAPRFTDKVMERTMFKSQRTERPSEGIDEHSLYAPRGDGREFGLYTGSVRERSLYTTVTMHPLLSALVVSGAVATALFLGLGKFGPKKPPPSFASVASRKIRERLRSLN